MIGYIDYLVTIFGDDMNMYRGCFDIYISARDYARDYGTSGERRTPRFLILRFPGHSGVSLFTFYESYTW